nr:mechanosensitive ion channel [Legionella jordanis]
MSWEFVLRPLQRKNKMKTSVIMKLRWFYLCVFIGLASLGMGHGELHAKSEASPNKLIEYLVQERMKLTLAINETKLMAPPLDHAAYLKQQQETNALLALNQAKISSLESFLTNQKRLQLDFSQKLKRLQQTPLSENDQTNSQERIGKISTLTDVNKRTIDLINEDLSLANNYQTVLLARKQQLELWKSREHMQEELQKLRAQEDKYNESLTRLYDNTIKLQQEIKTDAGFPSLYAAEAKLLLNNQVVNLTQAKIAEIGLQKKLVKADYLLLKDPNIRTLQKVTEIYKESIGQLSDMEQSLKKMVVMLTEEQSHLPENSLKQQFSALLRIVNSRIEGIAIQQQTLQEDLENHQEELKKQISVRQSLSEYSLDSWPAIINQLSHIPNQFYNYLKSLTLKVKDNYVWQDGLPATLLWATLGFIVLLAFGLHKLLKRLSLDKERSRLSGHLYHGAITLLRRNIPHFTLATLLLAIPYLSHIPFSNYQLLFNLTFVWLFFLVLIFIARLVLLERISDSSGTDVRLYHRLKWLFLAGGWTTALMVVSHLLPLSILLQDIFNRLFMLFLLAVSIVSWKSKEVIKHLLHPFLKNRKRYFRNAIMLLVILIPLTLFTTAMIGLIGYINLAWTISRYEVQILMIMTGYVVCRGLLIDALELLSEWMISSLRNGWLWIEVFLKPLDKIFRVLLLMFSFFVLCQLFGWNSESAVISSLLKFGEYPLVNLSGVYITAISILEFLIVSSVFAWAAKWTREFGYRWLYRDARDSGIRNSLSVFTQYAVILVGGFIALRVLGLDFSGMSMVVGGLAVGMGFGLRDFASNIVGGLMLLIERPVREGDLITLGNYEGRVAHIGIRSMRVCSWDNMEVLIPNAETFNKPFTNWTHQDSIVRTVIPIKVSRADDPVMVQQLILDVLAIIPEIVNEPAPQVFLKQIDDALIEFEIRYFINVQLHTRFEIRSKVLFAITSQFKAAGVKPPIPPISVELKEGEQHASTAKSKAFEE